MVFRLGTEDFDGSLFRNRVFHMFFCLGTEGSIVSYSEMGGSNVFLYRN